MDQVSPSVRCPSDHPTPSPNQLVKELQEEAHSDDCKQKELPTGLVLCSSTTSLMRNSTSASASYHLKTLYKYCILVLGRITVLCIYVQCIVTDQAVWSVSQSCPAKTAEPIEMPFRL